MRRVRLDGNRKQPSVNYADLAAPSVPPHLRESLMYPVAPPVPLLPRRGTRLAGRGFDALGRRLPPGPPPPRSWTSTDRPVQSGPSKSFCKLPSYELRLLPDQYKPGCGSLMDIVLRKLALDWEYQRQYLFYYLSTLDSRLRTALISYITRLFEPGLRLSDLKLILTTQVPDDEKGEEIQPPDHSTLNEGITHLDLSNSVGRSIRLRELSSLLFPEPSREELLALPDSWECEDLLNMSRPLLPNLTHLSLAATPETSHFNSWRQLLSISSNCHTLTHLSLAFWPMPTLTPNSTKTHVLSPSNQLIPAGGTTMYSHTLDDDWSEAILLLRRLSQRLYQLEYLDLTGCGSWFKALTAQSDGDQVDWVGDWGKITELVMWTGYEPPSLEDGIARVDEFNAAIDTAREVERTIWNRRAGRGRFFTVDTDEKV